MVLIKSLLRLDRVILSLIAGFIILAIFDSAQVLPSFQFTIDALISMAPFMLLAILFAAYIKATGADQIIASVFSGNPYKAVASAALVGAISPFCSCGVIPLIAAMLGSGVPLAPVMAFWIASPIMDPEMFILTSAGVGTPFALFKTASAISMGLISGGSILLVQRFGWLTNDRILKTIGCDGCCSAPPPLAGPVSYHWKFWTNQASRQAFVDELRTIGWFLLKWLALAFFLESLMLRYVPTDWMVQLLGHENRLAIPTAALVGIPSYLNGYAAIPLTAGLLDIGISKGAAMTFVTAGAVTSMPAAIAVFALVRKPVFVAYIVLGIMSSILAGYAYQFSSVPVVY